jgi:hypothetical protein
MDWNRNNFGNVDTSIDISVEELNELDRIGEESSLDMQQRERRMELSSNIWNLKPKKESILLQKSRINWLLEGDVNSRFFHISLKSRRSKTAISGLYILMIHGVRTPMR